MKTVPSAFSVLLLLSATLGACGGGSYTLDVRNAAQAGTPGAPYEVVVYSDFQCPYCRAAAQALDALVKKSPEKLHLYFKHFPLRQHPQSEKAAAAAEAAGMQGKFWPMHDIIFRNATSLTDESYERFADMLGLDVARFERDMTSQAVADRIAADRSEAEMLGLDGTPYFIVNGAPYRGSFYDLVKEIEDQPSP